MIFFKVNINCDNNMLPECGFWHIFAEVTKTGADMKRIMIALLLLAGFQAATAREYRKPSFAEELVCRLGDITPDSVKVSGSTQGFAIWGNYGFVLHDKGQCVVIDIDKREYVSTFKLEGNTSHCNNASFGVEYAGKDSRFPLLYISECKGSHRCYVTDITLDGGKIVQTLYYSGEGYTGSFDWFVDRKHGIIYTYGSSAAKRKTVKKFRLPKLSDSDASGEVHLTEADVLDEFSVSGINIYQGSAIKGRYAYLGDGYPPYDRSFHVLDMKEKRIVATIDLNHLKYEPEGTDIRDGWLYIVMHVSKQGRNGYLYRFRLSR